MFRLAVLLVGVTLTQILVEAIDDSHTHEIWNAFKEKYGKTYDSPEEEEKARDNFESNMIHSAHHNMKDEHSYTKDVHEYSDMTTKEQIQTLCKTVMPANITRRYVEDLSVSERTVPASVNWVTAGKVTPVKSQGPGCGSCWSFTVAQAMESQAAIKYNGLWVLSEQQLIDCANGYGTNNGCEGGWPDSGFDYLASEGGLVEESCYPYTEKDGTCQSATKTNCYHFKTWGYADIAQGDEQAVAQAVAENGPLAVAIWVSDDFMHYSGGIFTDPNWNNQDVNHGVLLVGYGTSEGQDYWLMKNSWGTSWGEKGYIRLARNANNMISVASFASYPKM